MSYLRLRLIAAVAIALTLAGIGSATSAVASTSGVVISEFRFRGPVGGSDEFVELVNAGSSPVDISGWRLQGCSSTTGAASNRAQVPGGVVLGPGQHYLFTNSSTSGGPYSGTVPGNTTYATGFSDGSGARMTLADGTTVVDGVGGTGIPGTDCREGTGISGMPTTNGDHSYERVGGTQDTNDNAIDFTGPKAGNPQNWTVADAAPSVSATDPSAGAVEVARNAPISITFSEAVGVTDGWFSITCATSGVHAASASGGPTTYTLDPATDFAANEQCTVVVYAANVTDSDESDPPDTMAADFTFSFQTTEGFVCGDPATPIHAIQGSGATAALTGSRTIEGVVVGDYQGTGQFNGYFVQEEPADQDADPLTSEGIFVFSGSGTNNVNAGDLVRVRGTAGEFSGMTQLSAINALAICSTGASVPATSVSLPVAAVADLERYEGMLVHFSQTLTATEVFTLGRFGEVSLSGVGRLYTPTAITTPGAAAIAQLAQNNRSRIILDDGNNQQNIDPTRYPTGGLSATNTLRVGDTLPSLTGVLEFRFNVYRIQPVGAVDFAGTNLRTAAPPAVGGNLRLASFNVLNYFNGDGLGGGFPTERGANTQFELDRQEAKIVSALKALNGDVLGLMEIENDAGPNSALADLVAALNAATAPGTYSYIDTGVIGGDAIKVALIYKTAAAVPVGDWKIITSAVDPRFDDTRSRPSLAQTFMHLGSGQKLTVVVNHLKSKGSACAGDPDTGDGSGNCNQTRTSAAAALVDWLGTDPTGSGDSDFLIIGDLNSYTFETPITTIEAGGYTNLVRKYGGLGAYSFVFNGESGYLDHALGTSSLEAQVTGVTDWHINPDEPIVLDYNVEFKTANQINTFYDPGPYRASDHDPVLIGLNQNVSFASLCVLTTFFVDDPEVAASLCDKLRAAEAAAARGNANAKKRSLDAFVKQVQAQSGKSMTAAEAATLIELAGAL